MNEGALESSTAQQMIASATGSSSTTSPNWLMNNMMVNDNMIIMRPPPRPQPTQSQQQTSPLSFPTILFPPPPASSSSSSSYSYSFSFSSPCYDDNQELPQSWSQLLLGELVGEEGDQKSGTSDVDEAGKQQQFLFHKYCHGDHPAATHLDYMKQDNDHLTPKINSYAAHEDGNGHSSNHKDAELHHQAAASWSRLMMSQKSSVTSLTTSYCSLLDLSEKKNKMLYSTPPSQDRSAESNDSSATGGPRKKTRVQSPTIHQSTSKVRKEKLGDRISALHQLVSPFGKTDTASVLLEAIGYIKFLHCQIEALRSPYLESENMKQMHHTVPVERSVYFSEEPCQEGDGGRKELRRRGLCIVPISSTLIQFGVGDNGADYWAPSLERIS